MNTRTNVPQLTGWMRHAKSERNLVIVGLVIAGAVFCAYVQTLHFAVERGQSQISATTVSQKADSNR